MINRFLTPRIDNSFFLFGPRGCGKSTLLKTLFASFEQNKILWIDLLEDETAEQFSKHPGHLKDRVLAQKPKIVVMDEIQKIPPLLDYVHSLIESTQTQFVMTGSSARKLKRGAGNLLAGRAFVYELDSFTSDELSNIFNLQYALEFGLLPKLYQPSLIDTSLTWDQEQKKLYLKAYVRTYLKEEIQLEQEVRKIEAFRNFLEIAAQMNGHILNYSKISEDVGIDDKTVFNYFKILEDTLIGFFLDPYHRSIRKRQREAPKFYFFDTGIVRALTQTLDVPLHPQTSAFGHAFEHFILLEIIKKNKIYGKDFRFSYLRTKDDAEIDLLIEKSNKVIFVCEIKSTNKVSQKDVLLLKQFQKDFPHAKYFILSNELHPRLHEGVMIYPWQQGIQKIFEN